MNHIHFHTRRLIRPQKKETLTFTEKWLKPEVILLSTRNRKRCTTYFLFCEKQNKQTNPMMTSKQKRDYQKTGEEGENEVEAGRTQSIRII